MSETTWAIATAREVAEDFSQMLGWPGSVAGTTAVGFGLRGPHQLPHLIVSRRVRAERLRGSDLPTHYRGFAVLEEANAISSAAYWGDRGHYILDRAKRRLSIRPNRSWPCWPGAPVKADKLRKAGTLGCYVRETRGKDRFALTCAHVLTTSRVPGVGISVTSYTQGGYPRDVALGRVMRCGCVGDHPPLDCTLIKVEPHVKCTNVIPKIGRLSKDIWNLDSIALGTRVCKFGASSGYTVGVISAVQNIRRESEDEFQEAEDGDVEVIKGVAEVTPDFEHQHRCTSFCSRGDSGSVVVLRVPDRLSVPAVGLLVARATLLERGYMIGLDRVFDCLGVEMA